VQIFNKFHSICGKWKIKYRSNISEEAWFIMTNFSDLETTINAYKKRMGIEEMFRYSNPRN
jgi:hypothetical protein